MVRATLWLGSLAVVALLLTSVLAGCSSSGAAPAADPPPVSVSVSPTQTSVAVGGTVQFTATVQNSTIGVIWEVNSMPGGTSAIGTVTAAGLYTAPTTVPNPNAVTVTAAFQADPTITSSATVTVTPAPPPSVSVTGSAPTVVTGGTVIFTASVQNSNSPLLWQVNSITGGNSSIGRIISSGAFTAIYTAPVTVPSAPTVIITALLQSDLQTSGSASLTITPASGPIVSVTVSPPTTSVAVGAARQFTATVQNSTSGVNWEVNGIIGGTSTVGTISTTGLYAAPSSVPNPATVAVTAVLQINPNTFGSAGVTVTLPAAFIGMYSWRNDTSLTGQNQQETILTPATVSGGKFGKLFACPVDGYVYAQPLYVANVTIPGNGTHNVVYAATENDSVYAFDADTSPCEILWQGSFLNPGAGVTTVPSALVGSADITPQIGITGTPVIDPNAGILYVVAETEESGNCVFRLHALSILTGIEAPGSPVAIQASVTGTGDGSSGGHVVFDPLTANQRS